MVKIASYLLAGLVIGFAIASWSGWDSLLDGDRPLEDAGTKQRLERLENALELERRERLSLEDQIADLEEELAALRTDSAIIAEASAADYGSEIIPDEENAESFQRLAEEFLDSERSRSSSALSALGSREDRISSFIDAGFSPERARWIVERTDELRMELLRSRFEAGRDGEPVEIGAAFTVDRRLRDELGDTDYQTYLEALGRPTTIAIANVFGSSPASRAGFLPGDEIIAYAGERVFDMSELNRLSYEGELGETVAVDLLREGQQMQLYLPRGPMGIAAGRRIPVAPNP